MQLNSPERARTNARSRLVICVRMFAELPGAF